MLGQVSVDFKDKVVRYLVFVCEIEETDWPIYVAIEAINDVGEDLFWGFWITKVVSIWVGASLEVKFVYRLHLFSWTLDGWTFAARRNQRLQFIFNLLSRVHTDAIESGLLKIVIVEADHWEEALGVHLLGLLHLIKHHEERSQILNIHQLLPQVLEISEASSEEDSDTLEHEQIPKPKWDILIDVQSEEAHEPLEGQERWVETESFEVLR